MGNPTTWIRFASALMPSLLDLARALFERHKGDVEASRQELRAIRNHGAQLLEFEREIQSRLDLLKARQAAKGGGK